jgi:hypothetical protein
MADEITVAMLEAAVKRKEAAGRSVAIRELVRKWVPPGHSPLARGEVSLTVANTPCLTGPNF